MLVIQNFKMFVLINFEYQVKEKTLKHICYILKAVIETCTFLLVPLA